MIDLTNASVVTELLNKAVAEKGADYVYPRANTGSCQYFEQDGAPSCIVGNILAQTGFTADCFAGDEHFSYIDNNQTDAGTLFDEFSDEIAVTETVTRALVQAQSIQDQGGTWGRAAAEAIRLMGLDTNS